MRKEDENTEFKREYTDDIKKTVTAFANTTGGKVYVGVEDDGAVCGIPDTDSTLLRLTNTIRDAIKPDVTMFTQCSCENAENKDIVVVAVQRGTARPYYLAGKGLRPEGVFIRQGASTVPASEALILRMIKETGGDSFEEMRSPVQELTFENAAQEFKKHGMAFGAGQQKTLGLTASDGNYTNLALMLSERSPYSIKLALYQGSGKSVFRDRFETSGPLLKQIEEAYSFIDRCNRVTADYDGLSRVDIRDYPPQAIREALLNAVVHRDYSLSADILISIFDDRMEFVSIGGLVSGLTYDDIMLGVSMLRNKKLANIFYRLSLIESYGTGILKIRESYAGQSAQPKIEVSDNVFKITLPNINYRSAKNAADKTPRFAKHPAEDTALSKKEAAVLKLLASSGRLTRQEIQERTDMPQSTAISVLRTLAEKGLVAKQKAGRLVYYHTKQ